MELEHLCRVQISRGKHNPKCNHRIYLKMPKFSRHHLFASRQRDQNQVHWVLKFLRSTNRDLSLPLIFWWCHNPCNHRLLQTIISSSYNTWPLATHRLSSTIQLNLPAALPKHSKTSSSRKPETPPSQSSPSLRCQVPLRWHMGHPWVSHLTRGLTLLMAW